MAAMEGNTVERAITDAGYRGHNAPPDCKFKVYTAGQKRRVARQIKHDMKRRAAVEVLNWLRILLRAILVTLLAPIAHA